MLNKVNMCLFIIVSIFEIYETLRSHIMHIFRFVSLFWMTLTWHLPSFQCLSLLEPLLLKSPVSSNWSARTGLSRHRPTMFLYDKRKHGNLTFFFFTIQDLYAPSRDIKALDHIHTAAIFLRVGSSRVVLQVCKSNKRRESDELLAFHPFLFD